MCRIDPIEQPSAQRLSFVRRCAQIPIHLYRYTLSWLLGGQCRFTPTCSIYGLEAIRVHGAFKGWLLALYRILRCQPFCKGGYDPVPPARTDSSKTEAT